MSGSLGGTIMRDIRRRHAGWLAAAILVMLQWPEPADASVTCMVRRNGAYVCTFFCRDGMICDNANLRCLPGPALLQNLEKLKEAARVATRESNKTQAKSAKEANGKSLGNNRGSYAPGSTYYIWDGDPRE